MVPPFRLACRNMEIKQGRGRVIPLIATEMDLSQADPERSNIAKRREFIGKKHSGGGCKDLRVSILHHDSDFESLLRSICAV